MTQKYDIKKIDQYKNNVINFLNNRRYKEDIAEKPTHTSWGNIIMGKFYIDQKDMKEFIKIFSEAVEYNIEFSILEVQNEYSPIIIDIDLKYPNENNNNKNIRIYDQDLILNIIKKYHIIIHKYLEINDDDLLCCIFEKDNGIIIDNECKDGIHIIFPKICLPTKIRHMIRGHVVKLCNEDNIFESYIDSPDKIIDKHVVSSNGWLLYGSKKPGGQKYKLTKSYDMNFNIIELGDNSNTQLIKFF